MHASPTQMPKRKERRGKESHKHTHTPAKHPFKECMSFSPFSISLFGYILCASHFRFAHKKHAFHTHTETIHTHTQISHRSHKHIPYNIQIHICTLILSFTPSLTPLPTPTYTNFNLPIYFTLKRCTLPHQLSHKH